MSKGLKMSQDAILGALLLHANALARIEERPGFHPGTFSALSECVQALEGAMKRRLEREGALLKPFWTRDRAYWPLTHVKSAKLFNICICGHSDTATPFAGPGGCAQ